MNNGAIFENFVAQELACHGFGGEDHSLYYFNNKRQGELDFVIETYGEVIPIEVKSGKDYERHNALKNVMENSEYAINKAYVLCLSNTEVNDKITYLPIYMTMFIHKRPRIEKQVYHLDLSGLKA